MITVKSLTKKINSTVILDDVNFTLPSTGLFLIGGENGSGKTTLLNIICGIDSDYEGEIYFDSINFANLADKERSNFIYNNISYVRQKSNLVDFLGFENNKTVFKVLNNEAKFKSIDEKYDKYSQGQQKLMILNRALEKKASIYVFDEPFNELSDLNCTEIITKLKEKSKNALVIIVSHDERSKVIENQILISNKKVVSNIDIENSIESASFINKNTKIKFTPIIKKFCFKNLLSFLALFMLQILALSMFMATCNSMSNEYKPYLKEIVNNASYIYFQTKKEVNINNSYISLSSINNNDYTFKVFQSDQVLDGYAYCNEYTYSHSKAAISFDFDMKSYDFKVKVSSEIKYNGYFISKNFKQYGSSYNNATFIVENGVWNTDKKPAYINSTSIRYMSYSYAKENYTLPNNFTVNDDEIITNDINLISTNRTSFQKLEYADNKDTFTDMNLIYPDGVKITYLDLPKENSYSIAIVPDNKLKEISNLRHQIKGHYIFVDDNKDEIVDYIYKNNISSIAYDTFLYSSEYNNVYTAHKIYSLSITRRDIDNISYSLAYFIPSYVIYIFLTILVVYITISKNRKNNMILKSFGVSKFKRYSLFFTPFIVLTLLATIISYFMSLLFLYKSDLIFIFYFSWLTTILVICSYLIFILAFYILMRKERI